MPFVSASFFCPLFKRDRQSLSPVLKKRKKKRGASSSSSSSSSNPLSKTFFWLHSLAWRKFHVLDWTQPISRNVADLH